MNIEQQSKAYHPEKHRILLVEDMVELVEPLVQQLELLGYICTAVTTCEEARRVAAIDSFSCALIDLHLPDGSGLDILSEFSETAPNMIRVILTGDTTSESIIEALRMGAFDYLLKPIDLMTLRACVARAIIHHEAVRDRAMLVDLLRDERDNLREKIEDATSDIRNYAKSLEASNAMLHALVRLNQLSSEFQSSEALLRAVYEEVAKHTPLHCISLSDMAERGLSIAFKDVAGEVSVVAFEEKGSNNGSFSGQNGTDIQGSLQAEARKAIGVDVSEWKPFIYTQEFSNRPLCAVAFYFSPDFEPDEAEREFLEMCSHSVAFEWQRSRLLLHGAQQAALANIAQELTKTFLQSLTAVRATTDVLKETTSSADDLEGLGIIGEHAEHMASQTHAFLKLAQVPMDSVETVRLDEFIETTLTLLNSAIDQRSVTIEKDFQVQGECVLLNGAALASTFLDIISNVVRTVEANGRILLRLASSGPDHVLCEISHKLSGGELYGIPSVPGATSLMDMVKAHPRFMLAQRTVNACGGQLTLERSSGSKNTFRIVLPRNALDLSSTQEQLPS